MPEILVCPDCKIKLIKRDNSLYCESCGLECIYETGIYDFIGHNGRYWGEIPIHEMEVTLKVAREEGWRNAARSVGLKYPDMNQYILNSGRIDWLFHCLEYSKTDSCLDLGSGWGTIAFALSSFYKEVWALEAVKQRIDFQKIRQEQDNINNINFVRLDWLRLPFPNNYFDLVVANGVFEWIGLSDLSRGTKQVQVDFLEEVNRVLKPGGCLYIGIENRFGYSLLLGGKDHGGLRFTSILPRRIADIVVKLLRKKDDRYSRDKRMKENWASYRTYTYSFWKYKRILKESGFNHSDVYWTLSYNNPKYSGTFDSDNFELLRILSSRNIARKRTFRSFVVALFWSIPKCIIKLSFFIISPDFLIFAYKGSKTATFESKLIQLEHPDCCFMRVSGSFGTNSKVSYFFSKKGQLSSVIKFPRFKSGANELENEEMRMGTFNRMTITREHVDSTTVFVEDPILANKFRRYNISHNLKVLDWLIKFQDKTHTGFWNFEEIKSKIETLIHFLSKTPIDKNLRSQTRNKMEQFIEQLREIKLPKNAEHGDFCSGNILINRSGSVYVTDWELYLADGEPLFDFIFYILDNCCIKGDIPNSLRSNLYGSGKYSPILNILIAKFSQQKGFDAKLFLQAIPYTILRCIYRVASKENESHLDIQFYINLLQLISNYIDEIHFDF